ncbi:DUF1294 domain-containing protein [Aquisphaera insulae]|uniref:DUF1294 domain-containing protein n=1 Tax=Aquisphaera insulae TaxID=2712864 RepID=UPI0013EDE668|nr:DUF1294 domain-containing protein [Aquisphaera insulae]
MRLDGTIRDWNDERGFGFISPARGGADVFFHIKAFDAEGGRPQVGQAVSFEVEQDLGGKTRAAAVRSVHRGRSAPAPVPAQARGIEARRRWGTPGDLAIPAFLVLYLVAVFLWQVPHWVAGVYLVASVLAFVIYGLDKAAARANTRRVPESTLLAIGLLGGWPGARIAQQVFRHKTSKTSFQVAFWITVVLNVAAFLVLFSPLARRDQSL